MKATEKLKELYNEFIKLKAPNMPEYARSYPTYFFQSGKTNGLTRCIIAYIRLNGWQAERISSTGRYIDKSKMVTDVLGNKRKIGTGDWIKGTGTSGTADISATILGKSIKIEVKNEKTKDTIKENQEKYMNSIDLSGGIYYIATNFESFVSWFDSNFKKHHNILEVYKYFINNKIVI